VKPPITSEFVEEDTEVGAGESSAPGDASLVELSWLEDIDSGQPVLVVTPVMTAKPR
jgi:hypothetical protein